MRHGSGHGMQWHVRILGPAVHLVDSWSAEHRRHERRLPAALDDAMVRGDHHGRRYLLHRSEPDRYDPQKAGGLEDE